MGTYGGAVTQLLPIYRVSIKQERARFVGGSFAPDCI
jgi:hypothetical protein